MSAIDWGDEVQAATIRRLSAAERFARALALTAYTHGLAWQGARLHSGSRGTEAVIDRFVTQLHGEAVARAFRAARHVRNE